jgi:hypothetical protein
MAKQYLKTITILFFYFFYFWFFSSHFLKKKITKLQKNLAPKKKTLKLVYFRDLTKLFFKIK